MIIQGDCLEQMKTLEDNSVDAIVTDPPYGWSFMGKKWDYDVPSVEVWQEALRVLKPGGHALVACGTRTQHRMAVNLEDAGFEIRDLVAWVYGSGFPKSLNIGKKIKEWEGWGTALKPAMELWTLCRKPFKGTVAENVLKWGVGGINIDGSRVEVDRNTEPREYEKEGASGMNCGNSEFGNNLKKSTDFMTQGRFPANLIHDGSEEVVSGFPNTSGAGNKIGSPKKAGSFFGKDHIQTNIKYDMGGSASRFFYCAKASKSERNMGCEEQTTTDGRKKDIDNAFQRGKTLRNNNHPTVKPLSLMKYLCRLITPPKGTVLDPYMGSGTTGMACREEGFNFIGIELEPDYIKIAEARIKAVPERLI